MKFGKARCELRNPGPGVEHRELPCYSGFDDEKAIGKLDNSRRSNGLTMRFGKNLANSKIAYLKSR